MMQNLSRALLRATIPLGLVGAILGAQQPSSTPTPGARRGGEPVTSSRPWSLCGPGRYDLTAAGTSVGSETFDVTCEGGRYTGRGRTQLSSGAMTMDLNTTIELGSDLVPTSVSVKGTAAGQTLDQSVTFANGTATASNAGQSQQMPYTPGAAWIGGNIYYTMAFVAARYDEAKGGVQQFPVFPAMTVSLEKQGTDTAKAGAESAVFTRFVMRIGPQEVVLWRDAEGRLAIIGVPGQQFAATRPESAKWTAPLLAVRQARPSGSEQGAAGTAAAAAPAAPDYGAPPNAPFSAEEVTIPVASYSLAGTLLLPKGGSAPHPAVVMITGSGLQTRDSRIPLPGLEEYAPFRQIAERLAANGIAVLRVDDRGIGGSTGRETLANATTSSLAPDTRAQVEWLRKRREIDGARIALIGHSEGATIASMVAASDPRVAAIVMMAGLGKSGAETAIEQQEDMLRGDTTTSEETKASLRKQQREAVKTVLAGGDLPGQPVNAWTREYFAIDPLAIVRKVKQPVLIAQGERDRQVDQSHATLLADALRGAGNKDVTLRVLPTLNHLFLPSKTGSFSEYGRLDTTTLPDVVLDTLSDWLGAKLGVTKGAGS